MTTRRTILAAVVGGLAAVGTGVAVWAGDDKPTPRPTDGTPKPLAENPKLAEEPEVLTAEDALKRLGITDLGKHFGERNLTVKGKLTSVLYTGFPATEMVYIQVDSLDQIRGVEE